MMPAQLIILILLMVGLVGFLVLGTFLNKRTPMPEGCDLPTLGCASCTHTACSLAEGNRVEELKAEIKQDLDKI